MSQTSLTKIATLIQHGKLQRTNNNFLWEMVSAFSFKLIWNAFMAIYLLPKNSAIPYNDIIACYFKVVLSFSVLNFLIRSSQLDSEQ